MRGRGGGGGGGGRVVLRVCRVAHRNDRPSAARRGRWVAVAAPSVPFGPSDSDDDPSSILARCVPRPHDVFMIMIMIMAMVAIIVARDGLDGRRARLSSRATRPHSRRSSSPPPPRRKGGARSVSASPARSRRRGSPRCVSIVILSCGSEQRHRVLCASAPPSEASDALSRATLFGHQPSPHRAEIAPSPALRSPPPPPVLSRTAPRPRWFCLWGNRSHSLFKRRMRRGVNAPTLSHARARVRNRARADASARA